MNLLFPRRAVCMGCGSMLGCDRDDLCESCREELARRWVGVKAPPKGSGLDGAAYAHIYHGPAGGMVRNLKYRGAWLLAEEMGVEIARAAGFLHLKRIDFVTAVPMHPRRMRRRGKNHAELLARAAAKHMQLEYAPLLMRTRNDRQQARLDKQRRVKNLEGGFAAVPAWADRIPGAAVLLVDDVLTTGTTAARCAQALREAGAKKVYFAAYAHGERKKHG